MSRDIFCSVCGRRLSDGAVKCAQHCAGSILLTTQEVINNHLEASKRWSDTGDNYYRYGLKMPAWRNYKYALKSLEIAISYQDADEARGWEMIRAGLNGRLSQVENELKNSGYQIPKGVE